MGERDLDEERLGFYRRDVEFIFLGFGFDCGEAERATNSLLLEGELTKTVKQRGRERGGE